MAASKCVAYTNVADARFIVNTDSCRPHQATLAAARPCNLIPDGRPPTVQVSGKGTLAIPTHGLAVPTHGFAFPSSGGSCFLHVGTELEFRRGQVQ